MPNPNATPATGPECYRESLRLIGSAHEFNIEGDSAASARCIAEAQVLATLALAAATALAEHGPTGPGLRQWSDVILGDKR